MANDYIPKNDAKFDAWFNHLVEYVLARVLAAAPVWTHIPKAEAEKLAASCTAWHTAYEAVIGPHTKVDTEAKNDAKKAAKAVIRLFVNQYLRFPPVTNEDRTAMGIRNRDPHPTPVPAPGDIPEMDVQMPLPRVLHFRFRRANMKRWGKPADVHGMELVWLIADTPPTETEALVHSAFATRSPLELTFKESDRGKHVYYAVRWETGTVKKGKFSEILSAIIP
jgi:hypothetical protein